MSVRDRVEVETSFSFGRRDLERRCNCHKLFDALRDDDPDVRLRILRGIAAALRTGEPMDLAILGATLKVDREHASGVPTDRAKLMEAFRIAAREEARRLGGDGWR